MSFAKALRIALDIAAEGERPVIPEAHRRDGQRALTDDQWHIVFGWYKAEGRRWMRFKRRMESEYGVTVCATTLRNGVKQMMKGNL